MKTLSQRASLFFAGIFFKGMDLSRRLKEGTVPTAKTATPGKIYDLTVKTIDQKDKSLSDYKGQVLLIVNTASLCGFTPQYDSLEQLNQKYKGKAFKILAFPSNDFGEQEPGGDAQIKEFCRAKFSVSFDLFSKIAVKGPEIHPLYGFLTKESGKNGAVAWNFTKFLVGKDGAVAARFDSPTDPLSSKVTRQIEELLVAE